MTIEEIKKLIEIVRETGISELEVEMGEGRVKIRNRPTKNQEIVLPTVLPVSMTAAASHPLTTAAPPMASSQSGVPQPTPVVQQQEDEQTVLVKSPIVGTYYDAPSAGSASFVKVGDHVEPKQVLCIIESMKLMNEIEAEVAGTVIAKHVENGRPVEYGESLFTLRVT
jgi:acetyl-CoA carboxylase biotin carboxyl carrier protein